jgi:regulatory protein
MRRSKLLSAEELFSYAVKKLADKAASMGEIRTSLDARAREPSDVESVLARLKEYGYLNDARFAESFAAARLDNEGLGKSRVLRDLRRRRIAPDLAQRTVSRIYADTDELALIDQYIRRKYRPNDRGELFANEKDLAAAYRRLLRAGFTPGNSIRALRKFGAHPDLLNELESASLESPLESDEVQ